MTATEPASLDALLRAATPVEAEPFDLGASLPPHQHWCLYDGHGDCCGWTEDECDCGITKAREDIARYVNAERVRTEDARRWVDRLQGECAELTDVIAQVVVILNEALTWHRSETDNTACAVQDALALLTGEAS